MNISIVNPSAELSDCRNHWFLNESFGCWCLEDILYTPNATVPEFQRMSIYAPQPYMAPGGVILDRTKSIPIVFENNAAGYMQMPHGWLGDPRCHAQQYLDAGFVYITCGCRGRESQDLSGKLVGKSPATLVDLKTALRFLRHNRNAIPGDLGKIISVGTSAGGAMSSLLALTGDHPDYLSYLKDNGAFLDESDAVYAAQIYCPIIDLEHADQAYEWMFHADKACEDSPAGSAEIMSPFKEALSTLLAKQYIAYFNSFALKNPATGDILQFGEDGRSGSAYSYLMDILNASATKYLQMLSQGKLNESFTPEQYIRGDYSYLEPLPTPPQHTDAPHTGSGIDLANESNFHTSLGDMMIRPVERTASPAWEPKFAVRHGKSKQTWLSWTGSRAYIKDLDSYVMNHRRRMKPCTAFDTLTMSSGENQVFGDTNQDFTHFNNGIAIAIEDLKELFPKEYAVYYPAYQSAVYGSSLKKRIHLLNPMNFVDTQEPCNQAKHYRIRVGGQDADTAITISMTLALKLQNAGFDSVDYEIVWDQPHCDADYAGELCRWIKRITNASLEAT